MYKKVTHHITEEHFGHPVATEIKKAVDKTNPHVKSMVSSVFSNVQTENTSMAMQLRDTIHTYFIRYISGLRAYIISALDGGQDANVIQAQLLKHIDDLGPIYQSFWPNVTDATALNQCLRDIAMNIVSQTDYTKAGKDTTELKNMLSNNINNLGLLFEKTNGLYWPKQAVVDVWTAATNSLIDQLNTRKKSDWTADQEALKKTWDILVNGQATGTPSFADIFLKGILQIFPYRFF